MVKKQDDLTRLKSNKKSVRLNDLHQILKQHGWGVQSTSGSHYVYSKAEHLPIMVVKPHGKHKYCHPTDINKVIAELECKEKSQEADYEQEDESR